MKLSTKLISSFSCVIILLLVIGLASQYFNDKIKNKVIDESRGAVKELEISGEMESYLYQSFINSQYYLDEPYREKLDKSLQDSLLGMETIKTKVQISMQGLNLHLTQIEKLIKNENSSDFISPVQTRQNMASVTKLKHGVMFYNSLIDELVGYDQDNFDEAKQLLTTTIEPYFRNNLLPLVDTFRSQIRTNLDDQVVLLNDRLDKYSNILLIATIIAFLLSLVLAYLLFKSITTPLYSLAQAAQEIGRGNLSKRIAVKNDDEIGRLGRSFNQMAENLNKITFSKEYVDDIIESMRDSLIVTDEKLLITKVNSATLHMLDYEERELIGHRLTKVFKRKNDPVLSDVEKHEVIENYETRFEQKGGVVFPVNLSGAMIHNNDEKIHSVVFVVSNITDRKKSERMIRESLKEKETLLAEIHHRVKNNLAVISGLLQMQRWETENKVAQDVLQDSQLRVKSIALVHEKLYQSENLSSIKFDQYVEELVEGINKTFHSDGTDITFNIDIEPLVFNVNQAIPCSLLLNELIVNVHKHAFKNRAHGEVSIKMSKKGAQAHLVVKDNGQGLKELSEGQTKGSLGMSLLNTLVEQLNGEISSYNDNGATFDIKFKLESR